MALPPQFLEELRARLPLSDVVMKRMRLQRAGREFKAPCPFHNEKTPSFYVNDAKGFFHCFGCGAHGDIIGFVMRHDNLSFMEAVESLAGEAGLQVPKASPQERQRFERERSLHDLVEQAARFYERQLREGPGRAALAYLRGRGLDDETIARFRLGYAPADGMPLRGELVTAGYSEADMLEVGLFMRRERDGGLFAFFRNRVMFPVTDRRGRVVAFGGRILDGDGPKYINSAENPLFHKGHILYGMSRARQAASDGKPLIVTEGYMDVIACVAAGFEGAVAPLGTALTEAQIEVLWKLAPEGRRSPILCFDGDNAGRRAAYRAVDRVLPLLRPDHGVRVAFMPDKEDPDSLIRSGGAAAFQAVLDHARPLVEVLWEKEAEGRDLTQADAQAGLEAALDATLATIPSEPVRQAYKRAIGDLRYRQRRKMFEAQRTAWGPGAGKGGARKAATWRGGRNDIAIDSRWDPMYRQAAGPPAQKLRERLLLAILINQPALLAEVEETLGLIQFANPELDGLRQALVGIAARESDLDAAGLERHLSEGGYASVLSGVLGGDLPGYARRSATLEAAREGWRQVWLNSQDLAFQAELRAAERRFQEEMSEENLTRLRALQREDMARRGLSLDGDEDA